MAGQYQSTYGRRQHACSRKDLKAPLLIFGGLFLAATAVRALEASSATAVEEVKVIRAETPYIPVESDLMLAGCQNQRRSLSKTASSCRSPQESQAQSK